MWGLGDLKTSDLVAGEEGTQALSRVVSSLKRKRRGFPNHPPISLVPFPYRVWQALRGEKVPQVPWDHLDHQG